MSALSDFITEFNSTGRIFTSVPALYAAGNRTPRNTGKLPVAYGGAAADTETLTLTNMTTGYGINYPYVTGDGTDDGIFGNYSQIITRGMTIEACFCPLPGLFAPVCGQRDDGDDQWWVRVLNDGALQFHVEKGGVIRRAESAAGVVSGMSHLAARIADDGTMAVFRNGVDVTSSGANWDQGDLETTNNLQLLNLAPVGVAKGNLATFAIFETALTDAQILAHAGMCEKMDGLRLESADFTSGTATLANPEDDTVSASTPTKIGDHTDYFPVKIPARVAAGDDVNVPIAVNLAYAPAGFWTAIDASGDECVITKQDGTEIAADLVTFDRAANTGYFRVKIPTVSDSTDQYIYVQYGGSTNRAIASTAVYTGCHNQSEDYGRWYAMEEASGPLTDRTGNYDSTAETNLTYGEDGEIESAIEFNGTDSSAAIGTGASISAKEKVSWILPFRQDAADVIDIMYRVYKDADNNVVLGTSDASTGKLGAYVENGGDGYALWPYVDDGYIAKMWAWFSVVFDGSQAGNATRLVGRLNLREMTAAFTGTIPATLPTLTTEALTLGHTSSSFDGLLDEAREYYGALTEEQVHTAHYNDYWYDVGGGLVYGDAGAFFHPFSGARPKSINLACIGSNAPLRSLLMATFGHNGDHQPDFTGI